MNLRDAARALLGKILDLDLARFGATALALIVVGFLGGRCSAYTGPLGRQAELVVDSARVANAASDRTHDAERLERNRIVDSMQVELDSAGARLARAGVTTDHASAGTHAAVREVERLVPVADTAARRALGDLGTALAAQDRAQQAERAQAAVTIAQAAHVIDSLTAGRRADSVEIDSLRLSRDAGLAREAKLARKLRGGWTLGVAVGPGLAFDPSPLRLRVSAIQISVGAVHELHLPCVNPFGCRRG